MGLETMTPTPTWDRAAHEETVAALASLPDDSTIHVWGADWCGDCRAVLPDFAAALDAADFPAESVHEHVVDEDKQGELTDEYDVEFIPTIVIERDGEEIARFVESEPVAAAEYLAARIEAHGAEA